MRYMSYFTDTAVDMLRWSEKLFDGFCDNDVGDVGGARDLILDFIFDLDGFLLL